MRTVSYLDLEDILDEMHDYTNECTAKEQRLYFLEITRTGLFHYACGKVIDSEETGVTTVNGVISYLDLTGVLDEMHDYLSECTDGGQKLFFMEITRTGLFHDACGKVVDINPRETAVTLTTEY
jgi:hypothetical protein